MSEELKPCPFCGGTDVFVERLDYSSAYVQCDSSIGEYCACLARGPVGVQNDDDEEIPGGGEAIRAWNRRTPAELEPGAVPIPTSTDMARMMLALGHRYLKENAPEHLAQPALAGAGRDYDCYNCGGKESAHHDGCPAVRLAARELDVEAERREFEVWLLKEWPGADLKGAHPIGGFYYFDDDVNTAWGGWQASASRFRAEGGNTMGKGAGQIDPKHAETRMDAGSEVVAEAAPVSTEQAGDAVIEAARKLIKAKGRYHTEQSYKALMAEVQAYNALGDAVQKMDSPNNSPVGADKEPK